MLSIVVAVVVLYGPLLVVAVLQCREEDVDHYSFILQGNVAFFPITFFIFEGLQLLLK